MMLVLFLCYFLCCCTKTTTNAAVFGKKTTGSTTVSGGNSSDKLLSTTSSTSTTTFTPNGSKVSTSATNSTTPSLHLLNQKLDYQTSLLRALNNSFEDSRLALKRLLEMMSVFLDNQMNNQNNQSATSTVTYDPSVSNPSTDDDDLSRKTFAESHQAPVDNHTLHVSFGTDADPDRYPWAVALRGNDRDRCGGTLIDDQHVLTAAHCIGTRTTAIFAGSHMYNGGEEVKPSFYCVHFAYSSSNYYRNDLAVIRLAKPVSVRPPRRVSTVDLCNRSQTTNLNVSSNQSHLWMIGWGLKNNEVEPDALQEAQVTLTDRSMCQGSSRYTDMCVQSRSNTSPMGACTGDSGSGLFQQTIENDRWCLLGVTSSSNTHICEQTQFTTYVHAASLDYEPWLRDVLDRKKSLEDLQRLQRCKPRTWGQEFCRWYAC